MNRKYLRQPPTPAAEWDDGSPMLSWRGDGQYFACNIINQVTGKLNSSFMSTDLSYIILQFINGIILYIGARQLKFWSREGILQSTSEKTDGLEGPLHWR